MPFLQADQLRSYWFRNLYSLRRRVLIAVTNGPAIEALRTRLATLGRSRSCVTCGRATRRCLSSPQSDLGRPPVRAGCEPQSLPLFVAGGRVRFPHHRLVVDLSGVGLEAWRSTGRLLSM